MLKFYYHPSPNPAKVALLLEELGLPYELVPVDTRKGEQHQPEFLAINPNAKTPAIVDGDVTVFDSNAILLYLAEKTGKFLPGEHPQAARRAPVLADVRGDWHRPLFGPGRPFPSLRARAQGVPGQPLPVRGQEALGHHRRAPEGARLDGGRHLHHRRHGGVGLGAGDPVHPGRGGLDADARPQAPVRRDQRAAGGGARQRAQGPAHLQDRDGRGRAAVHVPAHRPSRPPEVSRGGCGCCPRPRRRLRPDQCHRSDRR